MRILRKAWNDFMNWNILACFDSVENWIRRRLDMEEI